MDRQTLSDARLVTGGVGGPALVALMIAALTDHTINLSAEVGWRIGVAVTSALTLFSALAFTIPQMQVWMARWKDNSTPAPTKAQRIMRRLAKRNLPTLRQDTLELVRAIREMLIAYHGHVDADAFVSDEIIAAASPAILSKRDRLEVFLGPDLLREDSTFPFTVRSFSRLADDLERAAMDPRSEGVPA